MVDYPRRIVGQHESGLLFVCNKCGHEQSWTGFDPGVVRCSTCDKRKPMPSPPNRCIHLGSRNRFQECPCCNGRVQIAIMACEVHGECSLGMKLPDIACCQACEDFKR